jgi:very-short-patch-repair endonuclease
MSGFIPLAKGVGGFGMAAYDNYPKSLPYNRELNERARKLRNNSTPAEVVFWKTLKTMQWYKDLVFNRQKPIGQYIVDFYCHKYGLVVEIDGDSHYSDIGKEYDEERTSFLKGYGLKVLRFGNNEVMGNIEGVMEEVERVLKERGYKIIL